MEGGGWLGWAGLDLGWAGLVQSGKKYIRLAIRFYVERKALITSFVVN